MKKQTTKTQKKVNFPTVKRILTVLLMLLLLFSAVPLTAFSASAEEATGKKITEYNAGDIIEFGYYPQSEVTDNTLKTTLTALAGNTDAWTSYGYYSGTGSSVDGNMTPSDYMVYKDIAYNNNKYRGVYFTKYRPYATGNTASATGIEDSYQDDNKYYINTIYWFKFDPIQWRVLDPTTGLVLSETILDAQAYNNYFLHDENDNTYWGNGEKTYYANNYEYSSIRAWLNDDFYNTAFSAAQKNSIVTTTLDNSAYSASYSAYSANSTNDKIFLLSYSEVNDTSYFANDFNRQTKGSAYAKAQGMHVSTVNGCSYWRLRSASFISGLTTGVYYDGDVGDNWSTHYIRHGIRPAFCFNTSLSILQTPVVCTHAWNDGYVSKTADCHTVGEKTFTCTVCGGKKTEKTEKTSHTPSEWLTDYKATCTSDGSRHKECLYCHEVLNREAIPALGHHDHDGDGYCDTCDINMEDYLRSICTCLCHKTGFMGFIWKILNFFYKLFGIKQYCNCGAKHW